MLHPTLVLSFPGTLHHLVEGLIPVWKSRLGLGQLCLEVRDASVFGLKDGLTALLSQTRVRQLQENGYTVDYAVNLVVMAEAQEPGLADLVPELTRFFSSHTQAFEARLHAVLLYEEPDALQQLSVLDPDPHAPLPTRVWPLSRWNKRGLWLPSEEALATWVQHFIEVMVLKESPLDPQAGREWVGLGVARLEEHLDPCHYVAPLWEAVKKMGLGPPGPLPKISFPGLPTLDLPVHPKEREADARPMWRGQDWEEYLQQLQAKAMAVLEQELARLEEGAFPRYLRRALLKGPATLQNALQEFNNLLEGLKRQRNGLLDELDKVVGLEGVRARFHRLEARRQKGRPVDPMELEELRQALASVDRALEEGDIRYFLEKDPIAQKAALELKGHQEVFAKSLEKCRDDSPSSEKLAPASFTARLVASLQNLFRGLRSPKQVAAVNVPCERAWRELEHSYELHQTYADRFRHYLNQWVQLQFLESLLHLAAEERRRAEEALKVATSLKVEDCPQPETLVFRPFSSLSLPQPLITQEAARLVEEGILEYIVERDLDGLQLALRQGAERLIKEMQGGLHGPTEIPQETWMALLDAASPASLVSNWPNHRRFTYVLGRHNPAHWNEPIFGDPDWFGNEVLVMRFVHPIEPQQILRTQDPSWATPQPTPVAPPEAMPAPMEGEAVIRENALLDGLI
ncbi:MAG: hypothetical protein P3W93_000480 [Thermus sp.]|nr:hypothetical protein [Thermus sp.]